MYTRSLVLLVLSLMGTAVFAQTFTVTSRSFPGGNVLRLDTSIQIDYVVQAQSASGLQLIPELRPTGAFQALVGNKLNSTWLGTQPITNWENGGLRTLSFNVHMFDDSALCGSNINFELILHSETQDYIAGANNLDHLVLETTSSNIIRLTHQLLRKSGNFASPIPTGASNSFLMFSDHDTTSTPALNDPSTRIILYFDWDVRTSPSQYLLSFILPLQPSNTCQLSKSDVFTSISGDNALFLDGFFRDETGEIMDNTDPFTNAPMGGGGPSQFDFLEGMNFFDITDIVPAFSCSSAGTVKDTLILDNLGRYDGILRANISNTQVRDIQIFAGARDTCQAEANVFGVEPLDSQFFIDDYFLSSEGEVQATLTVPAAWRSTTELLASGFTIEWFLRLDNQITAISNQLDSNNDDRELVLSGDFGSGISNPGSYYIEARITHSSGAVVSVNGRDSRHALSYDLSDGSLTPGGNQFEDEFFDPGETLEIQVQIFEPNNNAAPISDLTLGYRVDDGDGVIDSGDSLVFLEDQTNLGYMPDETIVNINIGAIDQIGSTNVFTLPFELLYVPSDQIVWLFVQGDDVVNGVSSTFRRYLNITELGFTFNNSQASFNSDFGLGNGGFADASETSRVAGSWTHSSATSRWRGIGGTAPQDAQDLLILESPTYPIGRNVDVSIDHQPDFTFNQSGGVIEYRFTDASDTPETAWADFVTVAQPGGGVYDGFPFPSNILSYFDGRDLFMGLDNSRRTDTMNSVPDSLFNGFQAGVNRIQFRFLFQDPSLSPEAPVRSSGNTAWNIYSFNYSLLQVKTDNIYNVDLDNLEFTSCAQTPQLTFLSGAPSGVTYRWYRDLTALYKDEGQDENSPLLPFTPQTDDELYFVRIISTGIDQEPIYPIRVIDGQFCQVNCIQPAEVLNQVLTDLAIRWPSEENILSYIEVINRTCPPSLRGE